MKREKQRSRIYRLRKKFEDTQTQLAEELNSKLGTIYTKSAVSRWETLQTRPPKEVLEELENMYGVRGGYLLEEYGYLEEATVRTKPYLVPSNFEFQIGETRIPVVRIIGGNGRIRYSYPDGIQTFFRNTRFRPSQDILENFDLLLKLRKGESAGSVFEQRNMIRLDDYEISLSDPYDEPFPLKIFVSLTDYDTMMVTNKSLNTKIPGSTLTFRDIYANEPKDFTNSNLANPLAINLSLVTSKDRKIYVAWRGDKVATNPNNFGPAISGTANHLFDFDSSGKYNPFLTAQREAYEEVTQPYRPKFAEIVFFGLARTLNFYFPFLFGELRLELSEEDIRSAVPQDNWDVSNLISIPFTIENVVLFVKRICRYMLENEDFYPATAIFSLIQSLLYEFPSQWERIIKGVSG